MSSELWKRFSDDYIENCRAWYHFEENPVIPATGVTWKSRWTANPDVICFGGRTLLYYRGNGVMPNSDGAHHDRIAVAEILEAASGSFQFNDLHDGLPVVDVGALDEFDGRDVLDPAAVVFRNKVWLYYSAVGPGQDSVGLAVGADGVAFEKVGSVLVGRAPDVVVVNDQIFMLYQKVCGEGYELYLAVSDDGVTFHDVQQDPVFAPVKGDWDGLSVVTARLVRDGAWFYIIYGGSAYRVDEPDYFGLARSVDLVEWERHPGNPIFGCGAKGEADGGAIWFPALIETDDSILLLYEGSRGKYSWDLSSAICMASIDKWQKK